MRTVPAPVPPSRAVLDHERLDVYKVAVELDSEVVAICRGVPRGHGWLTDQALRASGSTVANLVEAVGREGADRVRMLRIAKGSALELDAHLTLLRNRGAGTGEAGTRARALTERVVQMLSAMIARGGGGR